MINSATKSRDKMQYGTFHETDSKTIGKLCVTYCDILGFLGNMTYTPVAFP
jgi:hypothetical protein